MTDFPDWQAPQAHATAIAGTGVPLLTGSTQLANTSNAIAASGNVSLGPFVVSQIGYELVVSCDMANAATNPFVTVVLTWTDSVSGVQVATDSFSTVCGAASLSFLPTAARGPSKADRLAITIYNSDTARVANVNLVLLQNSRIYPRDDFFWVSQYPNTLLVPAFTLATQMPDENCLGVAADVTLAASASSTFLFGMYDGPILVGVCMTTGALSSLALSIAPEPTNIYIGHFPVYQGTPSQPSFYVGGSRAPLKVLIANLATTSIKVTVGMWRGQ